MGCWSGVGVSGRLEGLGWGRVGVWYGLFARGWRAASDSEFDTVAVLECDTECLCGAGGAGSGLEFDTVAVLECDTGCRRGVGGLDQSWSLIQ